MQLSPSLNSCRKDALASNQRKARSSSTETVAPQPHPQDLGDLFRIGRPERPSYPRLWSPPIALTALPPLILVEQPRLRRRPGRSSPLPNWTLHTYSPFRSFSYLMDDYNFFGGHAYFGSPLGGLHTYKTNTFSTVLHTLTTWWHYLQKHHISKYLHRSYDQLCTSLLLRNKNSSKKKKKKISLYVQVSPLVVRGRPVAVFRGSLALVSPCALTLFRMLGDSSWGS
jgi:hypothetical protein